VKIANGSDHGGLDLKEAVISVLKELNLDENTLVIFTGDRVKMGEFVAPRWTQALAWMVAVIIVALNGYLYRLFL
jgi:manganese transport protein